MDAIIQQLLAAGGLKLAVPLLLAGVAGIAVRGGFGLHRSRSADRKEFLAVFQDWESRGDLWLSVSIRHLYGEYLPPSLIRRLMLSHSPARALLDTSNAWTLFVFDPATETLSWRRARNAHARVRRRKLRGLLLGYFALALAAAVIGFWATRAELSNTLNFVAWLYVVMAACGAGVCLVHHDRLQSAGLVAERWERIGIAPADTLATDPLAGQALPARIAPPVQPADG